LATSSRSDDSRRWLGEVVRAGAVPFSGADGDAQPVRHFPIGVPVSEQLQDFALADGEEFGSGHSFTLASARPRDIGSPVCCAPLSTEADP
jgi:hypothetical protein